MLDAHLRDRMVQTVFPFDIVLWIKQITTVHADVPRQLIVQLAGNLPIFGINMIIALAVVVVLQISIHLHLLRIMFRLHGGVGTPVNLVILGASPARVVQILNVQHAAHLLINLILLLVTISKLLQVQVLDRDIIPVPLDIMAFRSLKLV